MCAESFKKSLHDTDANVINLFIPFLALQQSDCIAVRLGLVQSFRRLFGHTLGRSKDILNAALDMLTDEDLSVRSELSHSVQYLVSSGASEVASQTNAIVERRLWQAYEHWNSNNVPYSLDDEKDAEAFLVTVGEICKVI